MNSEKPSKPGKRQTQTQSPVKRKYTTPQLIEYGSVAKLTASSTSSKADVAMTAMVCL